MPLVPTVFELRARIIELHAKKLHERAIITCKLGVLAALACFGLKVAEFGMAGLAFQVAAAFFEISSRNSLRLARRIRGRR